MFGKKSATIWGEYDTLLCDLDGVIYEGTDAIVDAVESINTFMSSGLPVGYVTNNSSRKPETIAAQLATLVFRRIPRTSSVRLRPGWIFLPH